jgi:hypothetical protein
VTFCTAGHDGEAKRRWCPQLSYESTEKRKDDQTNRDKKDVQGTGEPTVGSRDYKNVALDFSKKEKEKKKL